MNPLPPQRTASARPWPSLVLGALAALLVAATSEPPPTDGEARPANHRLAEDELTGDDLYRRVLKNRFNAYDQELLLVSGDGAGHFSNVELGLRYKNFRDESKRVVSKTIAKYFAPPDVRHLGYLVINKKEGPDDQFVYRPSSRKVRRINVRGEAVAGTDFSFEDIVPPEFEDGTHERMPDAEVEGVPVYVVAVVPHAETESQYSKLLISIEKKHYVPLRTLYWDNKHVLIKQLQAEADSLEGFENVDAQDDEPESIWIARRARMTQTRSGHFTSLDIQLFEANPSLRPRDFSQRELTSSR